MDLGHLGNALRKLAPDHWEGSHTDPTGKKMPLALVEKVDCGVNLVEQRIWIKARFDDAGGVHTLVAKSSVMEAGKRGGVDEITIDGVVVDHADEVFGLHIPFQFPVRAEFDLSFKYGDRTTAQRFDFKANLPINVLQFVGI